MCNVRQVEVTQDCPLHCLSLRQYDWIFGVKIYVLGHYTKLYLGECSSKDNQPLSIVIQTFAFVPKHNNIISNYSF